MKVAIVYNNNDKSKQITTKLIKLLKEHAIEIDEQHPELIISVGGDGTLLSAFHRFNHRLNEVRFLGIHTGHLGFYTDWRDYEIDELIESLKRPQEKSISYPLLDVRIDFYNKRPSQHFLALNESTIKRGNRTMVADIFIKDELFERFRGDGVSISTPTGSTAYNKSVGGAVLHPSINAFQLAEIASLNNRVFRTLGSPVVIAHTEWLEIKLQESHDYSVTVDQLDIFQKEVSSVHYKISEERIHFASYRHMHFWHRVKDAFISED
ncbi:NAD kinase [Melissococcus plutonius]|uniref:NAD kinase n=3 Tax=Melissococcus plutonius TaxID=33970 RepID=F3Y9M9_MELPT|nr:NAD kinase [Melissococcus plutonius]BAL62412.1 NAD kinase [Melissococcus plutonius DAT561]AIM24745.1 putative inorganic polyphosphate/ATP-NAD kinase PpnK [Melissococcus plutonius S1]KMT24857.1 putative inorganic polyphosphate/ATP-NAD kinase PpnK [Melissococcus plutonius]KMT26494.1 putative inorganic polyphosphate/ATP-NAD kinase PpnK [Melissococcus plutonius]KMT27744.1 putative inorganic polyphosphate/ATP-NAD kinase PpnK [Melissococcus plutonius]